MTLDEAPAVGAIVHASISHPFENPEHRGKVRPALLIRREHGHWWVMGFTTNKQFRSGLPRTALPDPHRLGLARGCYLWGDRLTRVSALDIGDVVGWCDSALAEMVISYAHLNAIDARALRQAARSHHPHPPLAA